MDKKFYDWKLADVDAVVHLVTAGQTESKMCEGMKSLYDGLVKKELLEGKEGEFAYTSSIVEGKAVEIAFVVGADHGCSKKLAKTLAKAFRHLKSRKVISIGFNFEDYKGCTKKLSRTLGEVFTMADYEFDDYKSDAKPSTVKNLYFKGFEFDETFFHEGEVLGDANIFARKLANAPANVMTPSVLAEKAKAECEKYGIEVEVFCKDKIKELGMTAYLSVSQASDEEPKFIVMRYKGKPGNSDILGYVGKGLTYDSGGLSIKPTDGMATMKVDMGGSAAVISAMTGIARLKLPINVTAVVAACENMISGRSYKPGDIIPSMGGKSIYIGNTDAEGRLTLIDAITYIIRHEKVSRVIDIATLTGAAVRALGSTVTASITNNDEFFEKVTEAYKKTDEHMFRMPVFDEYKEMIKHHEADLTNSAGSPGMMTAGLFLGEFVEGLPWAHLDIAGPAYTDKAYPLYAKGATGAGSRPLIHLAKIMAE